MAYRPVDRPPHHYAPPTAYPPPFAQPQTAQPPVQIPFSDPFQTSRDPFLPGAHARRESFGAARAWLPPQAGGIPHQPPHASPPQGQPLPPPPPPINGPGQMPMPFDQSRRRSLGGAGSPQQYARGPFEASIAHPPPSFPARNMPPPSPPQMPPPSTAINHLTSAPYGPPTTSPFAGVRDLASFASHRSGSGMSISSILGGGEDRKPASSPHPSVVALSSTPKPMQPPSPGRARASSMREGVGRREPSPMRSGMFGEPRAQSAFHDRPSQEPRRDGIFASPRFARESPHSFRAFRPEQEQRAPPSGAAVQGRPSSQPTEAARARTVEEIIATRERPGEGRFATFRHFGEPSAPPLARSDMTPRHDAHPFPNGVTSQPREREIFGSPQMDRDIRPGPMRFQPGVLGTPMREEQVGPFRPVYQHAPESARESIETRPMHDLRQDEPRSSPPMTDLPPYIHGRNGFIDRPMTFEEHQRMEAMQREQPQNHKESDGFWPKALLGLSPEMSRKGRNSPLPQAVQGAQPRHGWPGGDNLGIKMEFGRMFSGLGSGVGSTTPTAGQSVYGASTPSRLSPVRHVEEGDLVRTAVSNLEDWKSGAKAKSGKRNGRRSRDEEEVNGDGRATPDVQRGNKRAKATHPAHHHHHLHSHHHHHHHHEPEPQQGSFNTLRFPSNLAPAIQPAHHHHHHHATHSHPAHHHHHHAPRSAPAPRKPITSVTSQRLLEEVATKPRKHLGSQLYTTELSQSSNAETPLNARVKFVGKMKAIPLFDGKENCTYTVRVPRYYFTPTEKAEEIDEPSPLEEICKRGQLWGTEVYTDDSDVVAAAVHSGWLKGDFGEQSGDLHQLCDNESETSEPEDADEVPPTLSSKPNKPAKPPADTSDVHITLLILPPLESYASITEHHVRSQAWQKTHDGMSFMIHRIDFVDESASNRFAERGIAARKQRIALEEAKRREAAASLLMFANGHGAGTVSVGA